MDLTKLSSTDAFVVKDIPDTPATGVVRMGRKILQSSASDLARSATYAFAAFGIQRSGASAGINAEGEAAAPALRAFVAEAAGMADLHLHEGKGVAAEDLAGLRADQLPLAGARSLTATGVVAAARWACEGDLTGKQVAVEGQGAHPMADLVAAALADAGAQVIRPEPGAKPWQIWSTTADVLLAGSKPGTLTHQGAPMVKAGHVIPWGPLPVTTKAYLMMERSGTTVLPDFVAAAGGLVGTYLPGASADGAELGAQVAARITEVLDQCASHSDGVLMAAFERAEAFMGTWTDYSPFGRPLAA